MDHAPFAHSICCMDDRQFEMKEVCAIPRRLWVLPKTSMFLPCPLYSLPLLSKRKPRHFAFISYRWFFGGIMLIDDKKEPYCGLHIVKDTLTEARRLIIVMILNDDSSASRPPSFSPSTPACPPSSCSRSSCRTSCCPPRRTTSPRAWRPSPARRRARAAASATCRRRARARR